MQGSTESFSQFAWPLSEAMGFILLIYPRAMGCGLGKFLGKMLFALGWVA